MRSKEKLNIIKKKINSFYTSLEQSNYIKYLILNLLGKGLCIKFFLIYLFLVILLFNNVLWSILLFQGYKIVCTCYLHLV